jgi:regulator of replication initiation timing
MTAKTEPRKIPNPLYAAAGAGELAYEQLRRLPERVSELRGRVSELRPVVAEAVTERVSERSLRADMDKLRDSALRNAQVFVAGAQVAQKQAAAVYDELVARGERIVAGARTEQAKAQLATAKAEIKDAEKSEAKAEADTLIEQHAGDAQKPLPSVPAKPTKRTRAAANK